MLQNMAGYSVPPDPQADINRSSILNISHQAYDQNS